MKIFFVSDTHFNHKNIIEYTGRPFNTTEDMNNQIKRNWNKKVWKEDLVIHLGDFALGSEEEIKEIRKQLNGTIFLLRGNHDHRVVNNTGFLIINEFLEIGNLIFSHLPLSKEEIPKGYINIHGHIHNKESANGINISVEKTNYEPIELEEIKNIVNLKQIKEKSKQTKNKLS